MPGYSELFSYSWGVVKKNLLFFIGVILIFFGVSAVDGFFQQALRPQLGAGVIIIGLIFTLINILMQLGFLKINLKFIDGQKAEFNDLFRHYKLFINYLLTSLVVGVVVGAGFILLILPGVFLAVKLQFALVLAADKGLGPIEAIKKSWELTKNKWWRIFGFDLLFIAINILGALAFIVGLLITIPVTVLSYVYLYRKLAS